MSKKRFFTDDWSELTNAEIDENVLYIIKNFDTYPIIKNDTKKYYIGKDITISKEYEKTVGGKKSVYYVINNKRIDGLNIKDLYDKCVERCKYDGEKPFVALWIYVSSVFVMIILLGIFLNHERLVKQKNLEIEKAVKNYAKTLPYYNEYKQTQSQIANYRDSLQREN